MFQQDGDDLKPSKTISNLRKTSVFTETDKLAPPTIIEPPTEVPFNGNEPETEILKLPVREMRRSVGFIEPNGIITHPDCNNRTALYQESNNRMAPNQESNNRTATHQEANNRTAPNQEANNRTAPNQENNNRTAPSQESNNGTAPNQELNNSSIPPDRNL